MAKILLVEDQEMNRDMLSRRLTKRGYEVSIAVDGAEGVEKARAESPDLILMDMSLPVMDGWEATRTLKADEATQAIPVIALTAHAMSTDREKALEAGCDAYETKPVDLPRLLGTMEKLLAGQEPSQRNSLCSVAPTIKRSPLGVQPRPETEPGASTTVSQWPAPSTALTLPSSISENHNLLSCQRPHSGKVKPSTSSSGIGFIVFTLRLA